MPADVNYNNPSVSFKVNGVTDQNSQRFFVSALILSAPTLIDFSFGIVKDDCAVDFVVATPDQPPFDLK